VHSASLAQRLLKTPDSSEERPAFNEPAVMARVGLCASDIEQVETVGNARLNRTLWPDDQPLAVAECDGGAQRRSRPLEGGL